MKSKISLSAALGAALMLIGPVYAVEPSNPEKVSKLLSEAKTMAFELKEDAAAMEGFTRMNVSLETHAAAINQIKDHVNALARQADKLEAAKPFAEPWQKTAIDRIRPFIDELTGYTYAVIEHLNGDKKHTFAEYKDYLEANADYSADLAAMIANFVDYGKAKQRFEKLAAKLEVP